MSGDLTLDELNGRTTPKEPWRMLTRAVQQGRSKQRGESFGPLAEPLRTAGTPLTDSFSILPVEGYTITFYTTNPSI